MRYCAVEFRSNLVLTTTPGGDTTQAMPWQGIPLTNTILLLLSSITLHMAHISLEQDKRTALIVWLEITIVLAGFFLYYQAVEYAHAYQDIGLTLQSGIYGNTFFMLTGFHGLHVCLGTIFLIVLLFRIARTTFLRKTISHSKLAVGIGTSLTWFGYAYLFSFMCCKASKDEDLGLSILPLTLREGESRLTQKT